MRSVVAAFDVPSVGVIGFWMLPNVRGNIQKPSLCAIQLCRLCAGGENTTRTWLCRQFNVRPAWTTRCRTSLRDLCVNWTMFFYQRGVCQGAPCNVAKTSYFRPFLLVRIDKALSLDQTPVPCPWCGGDRTSYHSYRRPSGLPCFRCQSCLAYFTRVSNTPLLFPRARAHARRFVTMLGWREGFDAAAHELDVGHKVVRRLVRVWQQGLILLDPSGEMEARVWLGVQPQPRKSKI